MKLKASFFLYLPESNPRPIGYKGLNSLHCLWCLTWLRWPMGCPWSGWGRIRPGERAGCCKLRCTSANHNDHTCEEI